MTHTEIIAAIENEYANPTTEQKKVWAAYNHLSQNGIIAKVGNGKTSFKYLNKREKNAVAGKVKEEMKDPYYNQFA